MLPVSLSPMLATAGVLPAEDGRWSYELKWDGVRTLVAVEPGGVRLRSRAGNDITTAYPELTAARSEVPVLLDGEVVAFDDQGRPDFGRLQERMHVGRPASSLVARTPVALVVFDVLHVGDRSTLALPYDDRRALLTELGLAGVQVPPSFSEGAALLASTEEQGLEGVVAKRRGSTYRPGTRTDCWVKIKHVRRQSCVVVGWKGGDAGRSAALGSLVLAVATADGLVFCGHVGTGFTARSREQLAALLAPLATERPVCVLPREHARTTHWVQPRLVVEVEHTEWTKDGRLRHPSFKGLRDDLDPDQATRGW